MFACVYSQFCFMDNKILAFLCFCLALVSCEGNYYFQPPNKQELLSLTAVIDINDSSNVILFEKSYQIDYPKEEQEYLGNLEINIIDDQGITILSDTISDIDSLMYTYTLPKNIVFEKEKTYQLLAKADGIPAAKCAVEAPSSSAILNINSINAGTISVYYPSLEEELIRNVAEVNIILIDEGLKPDYYALLLEGFNFEGDICYIYYRLKEGLDYFRSPIHTYIAYVTVDYGPYPVFGSGPYIVPFFNDIQFLNKQLPITLYIEPRPIDGVIFDYTRPIKITLLSIPKSLYDYEYNLKEYSQSYSDPFSEPVYLNTNIENGHGILSLCNSTSVTLTLPWEEIL